MSIVTLWLFIERMIFYKTVKTDEYDHRDTLEMDLTDNIGVISAIGSNAPYVGLLGTVIGIMLTFYTMGDAGAVDAKKIMVGLALALKATAMGLIVAMPAIVTYTILLRKVEKILTVYDVAQDKKSDWSIMGKCKKSRKRFDEINVIPFIDIMLVLLVMVLTTATFIKQGVIPIDLPEAKASEKEDIKKEVTIYVNSKSEIFFDKTKVDLTTLKTKLSKISKEQTVVLRSDKESKFQDFVSVMNILKQLNHEQLYIVTKE